VGKNQTDSFVPIEASLRLVDENKRVDNFCNKRVATQSAVIKPVRTAKWVKDKFRKYRRFIGRGLLKLYPWIGLMGLSSTFFGFLSVFSNFSVRIGIRSNKY